MTKQSPNVFIIYTDQQSSWTLGCYGGNVIDTPNIDQLAANGALLRNFFANSAVCTPSRGCFLTGRYPESHGAYDNHMELNRDEITFAEILRRQGYRTGYAGKWHLDGTPRPGWVPPDRRMGFEDADFMYNRGHWKKIEDGPAPGDEPTIYPNTVIGDDKSYSTDYYTKKALDFLDADDERPFCYMLSIPDPHVPVEVRPPYDKLVSPADVPLPKTFWPESLPDWAQKLQADSPYGLDKADREVELRNFLALYYGEVKLIDDSVGRIVEKLKTSGWFNNTIIIFTTDHGEYAGEHGLRGKNNLYETAYRIPMVFHWPGVIEPGISIDRILSTVDFQPTLLGLMGMSPGGREQGRNGAGLFQNDAGIWEDYAFLHHCTHKSAGIFTPEYELALVEEGESILFDRINDPDQTNNLYHSDSCSETVAELTDRIVQHHAELNTPAASWLKNFM